MPSKFASIVASVVTCCKIAYVKVVKSLGYFFRKTFVPCHQDVSKIAQSDHTDPTYLWISVTNRTLPKCHLTNRHCISLTRTGIEKLFGPMNGKVKDEIVHIQCDQIGQFIEIWAPFLKQKCSSQVTVFSVSCFNY